LIGDSENSRAIPAHKFIKGFQVTSHRSQDDKDIFLDLSPLRSHNFPPLLKASVLPEKLDFIGAASTD
jgi:hypothetical protein